MSRTEVIGACELHLGDSAEIVKRIRGVDAVITDPPYHGVKSEAWDNQWATDKDFLDWVARLAEGLRDAMADNGSLYWFASPQMAARVEVEISRWLRVINHIVWDKGESRKGAAGTGVDVTALRSFWSANTERLIFAEKYGADSAAADASGFYAACEAAKTTVFGDYFRDEFKRCGVTNKQVAALFPSKTGGLTGCVSNWLLGLNVPTPEQYSAIREFLNRRSNDRYLEREYEDLRREYEDLRREYEDLRRPFFLTANDEWGDVWRFKIEREQQHPTQKPLQMMRHIVKTSTRDNGLVFDPFMGSGTTGVACVKLGRRFVGVEIDPAYFDIACKRIETAINQPDLFVAAPPAKPQQLSLMEPAE